MNFNAIHCEGTINKELFLNHLIKPWSDLFGFEYDASTLEPIQKKSELSEQPDGVYRPELTMKLLSPKEIPYKGLVDNRLLFRFSGPILTTQSKAVRYANLHLSGGKIEVYPTYIYSALKIIRDKKTDDTFLQAMHELDSIITIGDMNFEKDGRGNSYKYDCPFYLSFLKTQVLIYPVGKNVISTMRQDKGAIAVKNFGIYCPYYSTFTGYHPAVFLDIEALRQDAQDEQEDVIRHIEREVLRLLAYAYQDPTNCVDENGIFVKLHSKQDTIQIYSYSADEAEEFMNRYI